MLRDLLYAARALRRNPFVTVAAVLTLAFGVGATVAAFAVLHSVLLRPLPYADPDRLVVLLHEGQFPVSPADYLDYRDGARSFTSIAAAQMWAATLTGSGEPARVDGLAVSADLFETLGVDAAVGRTFAAGEDAPGRDRIVVLSDGLWRERFGGDPGVVGRTVALDGERYEVVGVMPPGFRFAPFWATGARLWRPLNLSARVSDRGGRSLRLFARLQPGVTLPEAQAEAGAIAARLAASFPDTNEGLGIRVVSLHDRVTSGIAPTLRSIAALAGLVLLIACVNVSTLLLVWGATRARDLGVRVALGAGRLRLVRERLAESAVLAFAGGALGILGAVWLLDAVRASLPPGTVPRQEEIVLHPLVLAAAIATTAASAIVAGIVPALQTSSGHLGEALREGGRTGTSHARGRYVRQMLLAAQLALALALLSGAGLVGRSLLALQAIDPGFDPNNVLTFSVTVTGLPHAAPERRLPYFDAVAAAVARVPEVVRSGAINHLPLAGDNWGFSFQVAGRAAPRPAERSRATWRVARPGYFETMRLPVHGRTFTERDRADSLPVVIVNEALARRHWPGGEPIGERIRVGSDPDNPWLEVVGVAADARQSQWTGPADEELYVPYAQHAAAFGGAELTFVVRTAGDPAALVRPVQEAVWSVDRSVPVSRIQTMEEVVREQMTRERVTAGLLGSFAAVALALASIGVFSVTSYVMARRTREIGIRLALGAARRDVVRLAAGETLVPVAAGVACGAAAAVALSRLIGSLLYEVSPGDPVTFGAAAATLTVVSLLAGWIPARRASRIDPLIALRDQ